MTITDYQAAIYYVALTTAIETVTAQIKRDHRVAEVLQLERERLEVAARTFLAMHQNDGHGFLAQLAGIEGGLQGHAVARSQCDFRRGQRLVLVVFGQQAVRGQRPQEHGNDPQCDGFGSRG